MGRHFHSNSKALWETERLGGGATWSRISAPMATAGCRVGMNRVQNLAKVHLVETMYNQSCHLF